MTKENFLKVISIITSKLEGGYFHPAMFTDGRLSPKYKDLYKYSGETMFGIDRKAGAGIAKYNPKAWAEFWGVMDRAGAAKSWKYLYAGGPYHEKLTALAADIMLPYYEDLKKRYLTGEAAKAVETDPALLLHTVYSAWNGSGWFQRFATVTNDSVKKKDPVNATITKAIQARLNSGNTIIVRTGQKIGAMVQTGSIAKIVTINLTVVLFIILIAIIWQ
jgi:hypothetical protein